MYGIFLRLYLLMIGTMGATIVFAYLAFLPVMKSIEKKDDLRILKGTFELAVAELSSLQEDEIRENVAATAEAFGGIVSLVSVDRLDREDRELSGLEEGRLVSIYEEDTFYRRIPGSVNVLRIKPRLHGTPWFLGEDERITGLTIHLMKKRYGDLHQEEAEEALGAVFGFPVLLLPLDRLSLEEEELVELMRDGYLFYEDNGTAFHPWDDEGTVVVMGPLNRGEPVLLRYSLYLLFFILLVACAVGSLLWARPLWRDMDTLSGTARSFGRGELSARIELSARSNLKDTSIVFNAMAGRIEDLIAAQQELTNAVSHELRPPLARLKFSVTMLEEATDARGREGFLSESRRNIEELDSLVDDLLTYAKLDQSKPHMGLSHVDITSWMQGLTGEISPLAGTVSVDWVSRLPEGQSTVEFEPVL